MRWILAVLVVLRCAAPASASASVRIVDGLASATVDLSEALAFDGDGLPCRVMAVGEVSVLALGVRDAGEVRGAQKRWLIEQLSARAGRPVLVMYDAAAWPAVGNPSDRLSKAVRQAWGRRLDDHGVQLVIEHEHHAIHKRTRPMRGERVDAGTGVVYIDPGRPARAGAGAAPHPPGRWWRGGRWYLAESGRGEIDLTVRRDGNALSVSVNGEPVERRPAAGVFAWSWLVISGAIGGALVIGADAGRWIGRVTARRHAVSRGVS